VSYGTRFITNGNSFAATRFACFRTNLLRKPLRGPPGFSGRKYFDAFEVELFIRFLLLLRSVVVHAIVGNVIFVVHMQHLHTVGIVLESTEMRRQGDFIRFKLPCYCRTYLKASQIDFAMSPFIRDSSVAHASCLRALQPTKRLLS